MSSPKFETILRTTLTGWLIAPVNRMADEWKFQIKFISFYQTVININFDFSFPYLLSFCWFFRSFFFITTVAHPTIYGWMEIMPRSIALSKYTTPWFVNEYIYIYCSSIFPQYCLMCNILMVFWCDWTDWKSIQLGNDEGNCVKSKAENEGNPV
jgi:hypothetical protein